METLQQYVSLHNARFFAYHGWHPDEQLTGNEFIVNVEVRLPLTSPPHDDELSSTLDYGQLYKICEEAMAIPKKLLETVVYTILTRIRNDVKQAEEISAAIIKINPPFGGDQARASVKLHWKK